ncbi:uncharacterized protein LOC111432627 isoform X1 [Cucurbita moschata]|uniref:Uncharacterized protein LOC111432627 isoform X1 n=1 Tax=Cucurbita moschata TaxID=3662 RepID=A0A6J1EHN9_CUCMO|nr:uncharacterized protein LOC111432627 isoform X1 [Cucurbita moschata]
MFSRIHDGITIAVHTSASLSSNSAGATLRICLPVHITVAATLVGSSSDEIVDRVIGLVKKFDRVVACKETRCSRHFCHICLQGLRFLVLQPEDTRSIRADASSKRR